MTRNPPESFRLKDNKDPITGGNPEPGKPDPADLERAKEKLKPGQESTFARNVKTMIKRLTGKGKPS